MNAEQRAALDHLDEERRPALHRFSPFTLVGVAVTAGMPSRTVPTEFWATDIDDGETVAVVACPCGHEPRIPELKILKCECERFYFYGIGGVWSLNTPAGSQANASLPEETTPAP